MRHSRVVVTSVVAMLAIAVLATSRPQAEVVADRQVVIFVPTERDERLVPTRDALAFWNRTLSELQLSARLTEAAVVVGSPLTRTFENYAQQLWRQAGRLTSGQPGPKAPRQLHGVEADIVLFLSAQRLMSFAWPVDRSRQYFVAIGTRPNDPAKNGVETHNVIAHALGLTHNGNGTALMCSPCRSTLVGNPSGRFLPLTAADRARLHELYR